MPKNKNDKITELEAAKKVIEDKIKAEKKRQRQQSRKAESRRKIIVGAVALQHAEINDEFSVLLWDILEKHTTRDADRRALGLSITDKSS